MKKDLKQMLIDIESSGREAMKEALKQALINLESSAKFSINKLEEERYDDTLRLEMHDLDTFCKYWKKRELYPIGIGVNVPLTREWKRERDTWGTTVLGFLYYDLETDTEKWIYISYSDYKRMMLWFYDESVLEDKINAVNKGEIIYGKAKK